MAPPLCRHFGPCGGCDWQDRLYAEQLSRKRARLVELLNAALGSRAPAVEPLVGMRVDETGWPWRFRHKASFVFGQGSDGRPTIGHYAARSNEVVAIVECPVHADRANRLAFALHEHLTGARVPAAGPALSGVLRHLIVRTTRDGREVGAMLVVTRNEKSLRKPIKAFLATEEAPDGFYLNIHDRPGPHMLGRETTRLSGRSHVKETVNGFSYLLSPTAFFQTNVDAADVIVRLVLEAVPETERQRILDLYSGSGLFSVPLAARGHHVTAVEENRQAIDDAEANLRLNRVSARDVRLQVARVEDALHRLSRETYDTVILDPPRQGCPPAVIERVFGRLKARRVVYVSCNPEALASEIPPILEYGYTVDRIQPVDMFPHTTHIESVVTFSRPSSRRRHASATAPPGSPRPRARPR
ncbi:MAG TPA: 23S rRNA (uracil(1939)-C(5))-methyltransferase RlmD [Vicinamibacterales bacterium]|nr:23S rRNA (uracil(1939)-C(5))-methyltransferase RlmD [Vicinamibacterales bacterium]